MANLKNNQKTKNSLFLKLAFEQAKINLGSTKENPSVGCIVEKNGTVISSGHTSLNGRPHAEKNALSENIDFRKSNLYVTLEPCSHFGKTNPCTDLIKLKKIKKVYYSVQDPDVRSKNKAKSNLKKKNIDVKSSILLREGINFYESFILQKSNHLPYADAKIAISNDYFTKNKLSSRITNNRSRKTTFLLRSKYDCIVSTSKTINDDNSFLNCRIDGLEHKSPDVIIIDRYLKLKKNLKILNDKVNNRKITLFTLIKNKKKSKFLTKKGIKIKFFKSINSYNDFKNVFKQMKKMGYSRIFFETGLIFLNILIKYDLLRNIFVFKSNVNIKSNGLNFGNVSSIKKLKFNNQININLSNDKLYKVKLK